MLDLLKRNWWMLALRGVFAVVFGLLAFVWPGVTMAVLVALFGAYAIADGIFSIGASLRREGRGHRGVLAFEGMVGIGAGIVAFAWPAITAVALVYLIAAWAVATGLLEIAAAVRLRREIDGEWLLATAGGASVLLGILLMVRPAIGALALIWVIAAYAVVFGVLLLGLSLWLRNGPRTFPDHAAHA